MAGIVELVKKMENLDPVLRGILYEILEEVERQREEARKFYVVREEFEDLKRVVKDLAERVRELTEAVKELAEAQRRTEERVSKLEEGQARLEERVSRLEEGQIRLEKALTTLAEEQRRLAEAQRKTDEELRKLAEAQRRTDEELKKLTEAQRRTEEEVRKLTQGLRRTREEVGSLSRTMAYALENEAYRYLPAFLEKKYGFRIEDRFVRAYVDKEEINFLARARVNGEEVYLVGETVLRLVSTAKFRQLRRKSKVVEEEKGRRVIPFFVTHFAHPRVVEKAKEAGIIVIQSFEWV